MSLELLHLIRELQTRVAALEDQIKLLTVVQRKPTLTLPVKDSGKAN